MKKCSTCKIKKESVEFHKNRRSKDGLCNRCKDCGKLYSVSEIAKAGKRKTYAKNRSLILAKRSKYAKENRDKFTVYQKRYADKNRDKIRELNRKSYNSEKSRPKNNARSAARRANKGLATFPGFKDQINQIYKNCPNGHHVDHIVPLKGRDVCGLHVPWNLQYLPALENIKKGNKTILNRDEV